MTVKGKDLIERAAYTFFGGASVTVIPSIGLYGTINWLLVITVATISAVITVLQGIVVYCNDTRTVVPLPKTAVPADTGIHWLAHIQEAYAEVQGLETPKCFCQECGDEGAYVDFEPDVRCKGCKTGLTEAQATWREDIFSGGYSPVCAKCAGTPVWRERKTPDPPPRSRGVVRTSPMTAVASVVYQQRALHPLPFEGLSGSSLNRRNAEELQTSQSTTSYTYTDLATVGPSVTLVTGTTAWVCMESRASNGYVSLSVSGATTASATDEGSFLGKWRRVNGLTSGENTFTMKYRSARPGTYGEFYDRRLAVIDGKDAFRRDEYPPLVLSGGVVVATTSIVGGDLHSAEVCFVCNQPPQSIPSYFKLPKDNNLYVACSGCMDVVSDMRRSMLH